MGQVDLQQCDWAWRQIKECDDFLGAGKSVCDPHSREKKDINSIAESCGKYQNDRKKSISDALVFYFIQLEFCSFAFRSGSGSRGSAKGQPPFIWFPLPSLTSQNQDFTRVNAGYLRPQPEPVPTSLLSLVSGTLWCIWALLDDPNMQLYLELYLGAK